jgi:hypothetical protein
MTRLRSALAAGTLAALGATVVQFVQPTFVDSAVLRAVLDGLFVGATVYAGLYTLGQIGESR